MKWALLLSLGRKLEDAVPALWRHKGEVHRMAFHHRDHTYAGRRSIFLPRTSTSKLLRIGKASVFSRPGNPRPTRSHAGQNERCGKSTSILGEKQLNSVRDRLVIHLESSSILNPRNRDARWTISPCTIPGKTVSIRGKLKVKIGRLTIKQCPRKQEREQVLLPWVHQLHPTARKVFLRQALTP